MSTHPDADAFIKAILDNPDELTTRLVFADWLEETGNSSNVAWAHYIRLNAETNQHPAGSFERDNLKWRIEQSAARIQATLTLHASAFLAHHKLLQELLPSHQFVVKLAEFEIPSRLAHTHWIARENHVLPLYEQEDVLFIALGNPHDWDMVQKLQSLLWSFIAPIGAASNEILEAINRNYGQRNTESVGAQIRELTDTAIEFPEGSPSAGSAPAGTFPFRLEFE
jgi:uncharacterized protein (TIGR02996 family)